MTGEKFLIGGTNRHFFVSSINPQIVWNEKISIVNAYVFKNRIRKVAVSFS
jgi:hypothetical protein